jgi:hypothetical protein
VLGVQGLTEAHSAATHIRPGDRILGQAEKSAHIVRAVEGGVALVWCEGDVAYLADLSLDGAPRVVAPAVRTCIDCSRVASRQLVVRRPAKEHPTAQEKRRQSVRRSRERLAAGGLSAVHAETLQLRVDNPDAGVEGLGRLAGCSGPAFSQRLQRALACPVPASERRAS